MMDNYSARTALACEIARLDRQRFNEAVAAGHYPCAPETVQGLTRKFKVRDIIALYAYARMTDFGFLPSLAGRLACQIRNKIWGDVFEDEPRAIEAITIWVGINGASHIDWNVDSTARDMLAGIGPVAFQIRFSINHIRSQVVEALEEELRTLGREDE